MAAQTSPHFQIQSWDYSSNCSTSFIWYYGFSIQFSGEDKKHYFSTQIERPNTTISCELTHHPSVVTFPQTYTESAAHYLSLSISVQNTLTSSLSPLDISRLTDERESNIQFLGKYLQIDRLDLAPELQSKLSTLESRNATIEKELHVARQNSFQVTREFPAPHNPKEDFAIKKLSWLFDGFKLTLTLTSGRSEVGNNNTGGFDTASAFGPGW
jgi:hypothetical protein